MTPTMDAIDYAKLPKHIAIIMDGNGRWAKERNKDRVYGHHEGVLSVREIVNVSAEIGIQYLTLYAFSSENWQRPQNEVSYLLDLLKFYLDYKIEKLNQAGVKILVSGKLNNLEKSLIDKIKSIENLTANNQKIVLNIAFSYGGREEIKEGLIKIARKIIEKEINWSPGLYKIVDELIVNSYDQSLRDQTLENITVDITPNSFTIFNDGIGIDVVKHPTHQIYIPELIFGNLLTHL